MTFYRRCDVCGHEVHVEWGPETHSQARRELIEHLDRHTDGEIREWAMRRLVGVPSREEEKT